jgi:protein-tyrosine-phosphatase
MTSNTSSQRPKRVLIVCTGNICRSPMAVGLLLRRLSEDGLTAEVAVRSAGTWGLDGNPASSNAIRVMGERGVDISAHRGHAVQPRDTGTADLILVMEENHRRVVLDAEPQARGKVLLLSELAGEHFDVQDPYGLPIEAYRKCAQELHRLVALGYPEILRRLNLTES